VHRESNWITVQQDGALFSLLYSVFQKDLNTFYSGHRGHRTWHPVLFSYGDTLKTMPTNHKLQDRIRDAVQTIEGEQVS
jgi:hypothetical protein